MRQLEEEANEERTFSTVEDSWCLGIWRVSAFPSISIGMGEREFYNGNSLEKAFWWWTPLLYTSRVYMQGRFIILFWMKWSSKFISWSSMRSPSRSWRDFYFKVQTRAMWNIREKKRTTVRQNSERVNVNTNVYTMKTIQRIHISSLFLKEKCFSLKQFALKLKKKHKNKSERTVEKVFRKARLQNNRPAWMSSDSAGRACVRTQ